LLFDIMALWWNWKYTIDSKSITGKLA